MTINLPLLTRNSAHTLCFDRVDLQAIALEYATPCYVYSEAVIRDNYINYFDSFPNQNLKIYYAVKANSNLAILALLAQLGAGFDIVSEGELRRVLKAGGQAQKCIFSGVGKSAQEIAFALKSGIGCLNIESIDELYRINDIALQLGLKAPVSLRVNPNVDAKTHPYISTGLKDNKFGIAQEDALQAYQKAALMPGISIIGIDCHIGSQILQTQPYEDAFAIILDLVKSIEKSGIKIAHIDVGGGLGIRYEDENAPSPKDIYPRLAKMAEAAGLAHVTMFIEPGRSIVGNAGLLLTTIEYLKTGASKNFCVVDCAMNDLARPAMYDAFHQIVPVCSSQSDTRVYDVVGPICESGDWLGRDRVLAVKAGDVLAILSSGAYGFAMSSNYNSRRRAAEVMIREDGQVHVIRKRETYEDLWRGEC